MPNRVSAAVPLPAVAIGDDPVRIDQGKRARNRRGDRLAIRPSERSSGSPRTSRAGRNVILLTYWACAARRPPYSRHLDDAGAGFDQPMRPRSLKSRDCKRPLTAGFDPPIWPPPTRRTGHPNRRDGRGLLVKAFRMKTLKGTRCVPISDLQGAEPPARWCPLPSESFFKKFSRKAVDGRETRSYMAFHQRGHGLLATLVCASSTGQSGAPVKRGR